MRGRDIIVLTSFWLCLLLGFLNPLVQANTPYGSTQESKCKKPTKRKNETRLHHQKERIRYKKCKQRDSKGDTPPLPDPVILNPSPNPDPESSTPVDPPDPREALYLPEPTGGDDTQNFQEAIDEASAGSLLKSHGGTYKISDTIKINKPGDTIDLTGAKIEQIEATGAMQDSNSVFDLTADNTEIKNTQIISAAPYQGNSFVAGKVRCVQVKGCLIKNINIPNTTRGSGILIYFAPQATVDNVKVTGGPISALGSKNLTISNSTVDGTLDGSNGIAIIAYAGSPIDNLILKNNNVSGYGRWGIEITLGGGEASPFDIAHPQIINNKIGPPKNGVVYGALSCLGFSGLIKDNIITNPLGYGIEVASLDNDVIGNTIIREEAALSNDPGYGIVIDSHDQSARVGPTRVKNNKIELADWAILGVNDPARVTASENTILNPLVRGIDLSRSHGGAVIKNNTLLFNRPAKEANRYGVLFSQGSEVSGNTLTYLPSSQAPNKKDNPFYGDQGGSLFSNNTVSGL